MTLKCRCCLPDAAELPLLFIMLKLKDMHAHFLTSMQKIGIVFQHVNDVLYI